MYAIRSYYEEGGAGRHSAQQHQGGAEVAEQGHQLAVNHIADKAAGGKIVNIGKVHAAEARQPHEQDQETDDAQPQGKIVDFQQAIGPPEDAPAEIKQQQSYNFV